MLTPVLLRSGHLPPLHLMQKGIFSLSPDAVGFVQPCRVSPGCSSRTGTEPARGAPAEKNPGKFSPAANTTRGDGNHPRYSAR